MDADVYADVYDRARAAAPGWDTHHLENEWRCWVLDKAIVVKDPSRHVLSFCMKRGPYRG